MASNDDPDKLIGITQIDVDVIDQSKTNIEQLNKPEAEVKK